MMKQNIPITLDEDVIKALDQFTMDYNMRLPNSKRAVCVTRSVSVNSILIKFLTERGYLKE